MEPRGLYYLGVPRMREYTSLAVCLMAALGLALLLCGCDKHGSIGDSEQSREVYSQTDPTPFQGPACQRQVVTTGLGFWWDRFNHRMSLWRMFPNEDGSCPDTVPEGQQLNLATVGGSFTTGTVFRDNPWFVYDYMAVDSPDIRFIPGRTVLYVKGPDFTTKKRVNIGLPDLGDFESSTAEVLIRGFELNTGIEQTDPQYPEDYDPSLGYTSKGMGLRVYDPTLGDAGASFTAWCRFEPAEADRDDMNSAIPPSTTRIVLDYLVVLVSAGNTVRKEHSYTLTYSEPTLLWEQKIEHADDSLRRMNIQGASGIRTAFIGLTAFNWRLFGDSSRGDYIRELNVEAIRERAGLGE